MKAEDFIRKTNFMVNVGTDFDYDGEYKKLSPEAKEEVDKYFREHTFTPSM